jgi:hypothetical protein
MKTKKFDCVDMMHRGAELVRQRVEGMTIEQEAEYWRQRTKELRKLQRDQRRKAS